MASLSITLRGIERKDTWFPSKLRKISISTMTNVWSNEKELSDQTPQLSDPSSTACKSGYFSGKELYKTLIKC
jgi:hypothetical protein